MEMKLPGPEHPIDVEPYPGEVVVAVGDREIARTTSALLMTEAGHDPVFYLPESDLDTTDLVASTTTTFCPYKGHAAYRSLIGHDGRPGVEDLVWHYPHPFPAMLDAIGGRVAFYDDRVRITATPAAPSTDRT